MVDETGTVEAEYLRMLANSAELGTRPKQEIYKSDDELTMESTELDPLVTDVKSSKSYSPY